MLDCIAANRRLNVNLWVQGILRETLGHTIFRHWVLFASAWGMDFTLTWTLVWALADFGSDVGSDFGFGFDFGSDFWL